MKLLILLLISLNLFAYETHEEVDALQLDNFLTTVCWRLLPDCNCKVEGENIYDNLSVDETCNKPTLQSMETEFTVYKNELKAEIDYRNILRQKKAEAETKWQNVKTDFHRLLQLASLPNIPNPAAYYRDHCRRASTHEKIDLCITKLTALENKIADLQAENQAKEDARNYCIEKKDLIKNINPENVQFNETNFRHMIRALKCLFGG